MTAYIKWSFSQIPPGKIESLTLKLSVLDVGRVGKGKQMIGHIILPLTELDGVAPDEEPQLYKLDIEKVSCDQNLLALLTNKHARRNCYVQMHHIHRLVHPHDNPTKNNNNEVKNSFVSLKTEIFSFFKPYHGVLMVINPLNVSSHQWAVRTNNRFSIVFLVVNVLIHANDELSW